MDGRILGVKYKGQDLISLSNNLFKLEFCFKTTLSTKDLILSGSYFLLLIIQTILSSFFLLIGGSVWGYYNFGGNILGDDFSSIVSRQLDQDSMSFVSVGNTRYPVNNDDPEMIKMLAQDTNAQYLIGGEITDLTATITQRTFRDDIINRQFALEVKVYDGKTGHEIFKRNYRQIANWPFAKTSHVDTKSGRFWASAYGEMLLRVSRQIMLDLETELSCKITLPEVVRVYNDTVTMDLGRIHGVEVGDTLQLWHTGAFIDQGGSPRSKVTKSNISLTVTRVYDQEAELRVEQPELTNSIQIGDVMHKQMDY